jgi:hypothetical protein
MDTPNDPFAFLKAAWPSFAAYPMSASGLPQSSLPTTDPEEIERRIADLKTVEQWLSLNLNILKTTIQGLEIQKGTLVAVQAWQSSMADIGKPDRSAESAQKESGAATESKTPGATEPQQWWWSSMQDQFNQLVQAAGAMQTGPREVKGQDKVAKKRTEPSAKAAKAARASKARNSTISGDGASRSRPASGRKSPAAP